MTFKVFTRSINAEYYELMRSLLPDYWQFERCTDFNEWWHAKDYLLHILKSDVDFVVNIDEDCFFKDPAQILGYMKHMHANNFTHCGMPDRHLSCHRFNLYTVQNPFFNIFNMRQIRTFFTGTMQTTDAQNIEPYNAIFLELAFFGRPLNLHAWDHPDGISTVLQSFHNPGSMAVHTWYSREKSHRDRILERYNDVKVSNPIWKKRQL